MENMVSVIIPTYKRSHYLCRAIDSVLSQTYKNIEVIVVDDNPPDSKYREATENGIYDYRDNYKVRYIKNARNLGGALSRNEGIKVAKGQYITFLDDDDIYLPDKVERQLFEMITNDWDMSFTNLKLYNENNLLIDYREFSKIKSFDQKNLMRYHLTHLITGTPTFMYKTETIRRIGGFLDVIMGHEFYLMYNTIKVGAKIGYINQCNVIAYRHAGEGISTGLNKIKGEHINYAFKIQNSEYLNLRDRIYIAFRYNVILAIGWKRNNQWIKALGYMIKAFMISPFYSMQEVFYAFRKMMQSKHEFMK